MYRVSEGDRNTSASIAAVGEAIIDLVKAIEKLDRQVSESEIAPDALLREMQADVRMIERTMFTVDSFGRHCRTQGYRTITDPVDQVSQALVRVRDDMIAVQGTIRPDGQRAFEWWYKTENLAMSTHRLRESLQEYRQAAAAETFVPEPEFSLKDFALPAVIGFGVGLALGSFRGRKAG